LGLTPPPEVCDDAEATALNEVYGKSERKGPWCALGSVKSQIGHTKAAAGVAGIIKAVAALHHKVLPPTIKVEQPIEALQTGEQIRIAWVNATVLAAQPANSGHRECLAAARPAGVRSILAGADPPLGRPAPA